MADIFKGTGSGFCLCGRIESGMVCVNDKVLVCPSKEQAVVKNITIDELPQQTAFAGDQVSLTLANIDINNISVGYILSNSNKTPPAALGAKPGSKLTAGAAMEKGKIGVPRRGHQYTDSDKDMVPRGVQHYTTWHSTAGECIACCEICTATMGKGNNVQCSIFNI